MKVVTLKIQIKVTKEKEAELEQILSTLETPVQGPDGKPIDHLKQTGYEIMIMDRDDK